MVTRKLGLALSGGGFRASLFHIGVLARLAELDILRCVEVISTVSGGSIIGALYYLHLKRLLESKPDRSITANDYVDLVKQIEVDFLKRAQTNLRLRALSNFWKNWMMFREDYSRSDRMAELYGETFYDSIADHPRIALSELKIQPLKSPKPFHPRKHNRGRQAKVPMLIINATTLNTGRNWQFTAVDMGEREPEVESESFDKNFFLPAFRYEDADLEKYRRMPLSVAVSASACVPGILRPLALTGLYPDVVPQLVDGGVNDNQGISSILYEACTDVITSDASGQLQDEQQPGTGFLNVVKRSNDILLDRVRDQGLQSLSLQRKARAIKEHPILHLREDVELERLAPGEEKQEPSDRFANPTYFGIDQRVQRRLSEIRTDLDSFTEVEAYSLMYSGYKLADKMIQRRLLRAYGVRPKPKPAKPALHEGRRTGWRFEEIKNYADGTWSSRDYLRQLTIASRTFFKAYLLIPRLLPVGFLILAIAASVPLLLLALFWQLTNLVPVRSISVLGISIAVLLAAIARGGFLRELWSKNVLKYVATGSVALLGSLVAYLHLKWIDPKFLRRGRVRSLRS